MINYQRKRLSKDEYVNGILSGDRVILSKAITLVESNNEADIKLGEQVLNKVLPHTGMSKRIGITGVPGVGKSTFIEAFGTYLTNKDHHIAVLAIDPSSQRTGGSILGDKTRMELLANDPKAYIRPSPTSESLGGVANKTRETLLLCEAAGFDVILIETVGVGQSETAVKSMVDFFLLLLLAGAGDELQGIKKGIMEMADAIVINKADGDNIDSSKRTKLEFRNALHLFPPSTSGWYPKVSLCSSTQKSGLGEVWTMILDFYKTVGKTWLEDQRQDQNVSWMKESIGYLLKQDFYKSDRVLSHLDKIQRKVKRGKITPLSAARQLISMR
ncbi:MAG: methylmalonyl Co-A mutase-associated GTPase MeaB [Bacteroidota bacterium]